MYNKKLIIVFTLIIMKTNKLIIIIIIIKIIVKYTKSNRLSHKYHKQTINNNKKNSEFFKFTCFLFEWDSRARNKHLFRKM